MQKINSSFSLKFTHISFNYKTTKHTAMPYFKIQVKYMQKINIESSFVLTWYIGPCFYELFLNYTWGKCSRRMCKMCRLYFLNYFYKVSCI